MILLVANFKWNQISDPLGGLRVMFVFSVPLGEGLGFVLGPTPEVVLLVEMPDTAID